jgi:hypothetical protein
MLNCSFHASEKRIAGPGRVGQNTGDKVRKTRPLADDSQVHHEVIDSGSATRNAVKARADQHMID